MLLPLRAPAGQCSLRTRFWLVDKALAAPALADVDSYVGLLLPAQSV